MKAKKLIQVGAALAVMVGVMGCNDPLGPGAPVAGEVRADAPADCYFSADAAEFKRAPDGQCVHE